MTEYDNVLDKEVEVDYKNSFVLKGMHVVDVTSSECGRFKYTKEESMKEYELTSAQYDFYNSVKQEI